MNSDTPISPPVPQPSRTEPRNPWKSLLFYTEQDSDIFFGRDRETMEFLRLVKRDILSVLFARSGLGKTSLLRAGVIPLLRKEGFFPVILRVDHSATAPSPSRQIMEKTLATADRLGIEVEKTGESVTAVATEDELETLWEFFHQCQFWTQRNDLIIPVLILDQFEEIFTLGRECPLTREFSIQLADLVENRMPSRVQRRMEVTGARLDFDIRAHDYRVVLSLREDFVPKLDSLRPIMPSVMRNRFVLAPLDRARGVEIIRRAGGEVISETVANEIMMAVAGETESEEAEPEGPACFLGAEIEPAYLSVMCHELFQRMTELGRSEIGSDLVKAEQRNILDALYERSFKGLEEKTRLFVEDRLLTPSGYRSTAPLAEATREEINVTDLETLVDRRLLRFEARLGTRHVELSHDLLTGIVQKSREKRLEKAKREAEQKRREEFRAKLHRERIRALRLGAVIIMLICGICFYIFGWIVSHHSYCRSFTKRWGIIHPVGPLPGSAVAHRAWTLRLTSHGWFGKVYKAEVINATHGLTSRHGISTCLANANSSTPHERESSYEFVLDRNDRVVYEVARNRFGRMTWGFVHAPRQGRGKDLPTSTRGTFLGPDGYPKPQGRSRAEFVEIRYDDRGFEAELKYYDREGRPMPGPDHAYGQLREYDGKGQEVRLTSLNERGEPMNDKVGNAGIELTYDRHGNVIEWRALDVKGEHTLIKDGFHRELRAYDKWGRMIEQRFFDLSGKPAVETVETGAHRVTWEYDDRGNIRTVNLYDQADKPVTAGAGFFDVPAHERRAAYDPRNRLETVAYFDEHHGPVTHPDGWHGYRQEYDGRGFVSAVSFMDREWKPVKVTTTGVHRIEMVNNECGQPVEERFFESGGQPAAARDRACHMIRKKYDKAGNLAEEHYFDRNDKPAIDLLNGVHGVVKTFDRFRKPVLIRFFDKSGHPVNNYQGFNQEESNYDDYGSILGTKYYDKDSISCQGPDGVHSIVYSYDLRGLLMEDVRYDPGREPTVDKNGIHKIVYDYNDKRQQTRVQYFGTHRKPAENKAGDHIIFRAFDPGGRETMLTRLRGDGGPNLDRELGVATRRQILDRENRWIEQAYYGPENRLVTGAPGFAKATVIYQSDTRRKIQLFGTDGRPEFNPLYGYAIMKSDTGKSGVTINSYHGPNGELITGPAGYARVRRSWDENGGLLSRAWFGPDGSPVDGPGGYHRMERPRGLLSGRARFFDAENREITSHDPDKLAAVIFIAVVESIKLPAARAGLHAGDILWRYGSWRLPDALREQRTKGGDLKIIIKAVMLSFLAERDRLGAEPVPMTVIRKGKTVRLTMPPLPEKNLGVRIEGRTVPVAVFEGWNASL
ncbi:MAG: hypothetical protein GY737_12500 [Desulfobacteraceae bacterium]|nr:hypothetical protein [Desulfobacteraceae bacterium]